MPLAHNPPIEAHMLLDAIVEPAALVGPDATLLSINEGWVHAADNLPFAFLSAETQTNLMPLLEREAEVPEFLSAVKGVLSGAHANATAQARLSHEFSARWLELTVSRVRPDGPVLLRLRDVTRRGKAEDQLRQSKSRLRSVIAGAPIALLGLDVNGVFTVVDGVGASGLGATPELLIGRSVFEVYAHLPRLLECVRDARAGQSSVAAVPIGRMTYELRFSPSFDADDKVKGVVGVATDITERTRIEQMKNEFVSIVSHELRTPLTSIRGSLGLLEGGVAGELPDRAQDLVRIARTNSERLIRLINDILDIDKLEAGRLEFVSAPVDMAALLRRCAEELEGVAQSSDLHVRVDCEEGLEVLGDEDRLLQVMVNLLSNALKFAPTGSEVVLAGHTLDGTTLRFEVRDRGPGIPADQRNRLFRKFQQLETESTRSSGGSGLGLAISKAIVEAHSGRIDVESEPGRGSAFYFEIPRLQGMASKPARARPEGLRGRTVEIDIGGIPAALDMTHSTRVSLLKSALQLALEAPSRETFVEAHAEASILHAMETPAPNAGSSNSLATLVDSLSQLISGKLEPEAGLPLLREGLREWTEASAAAAD